MGADDPGVDLGILEWWGCMKNARKAHMKILGHAHFIKTMPILLPSRATTWLQIAPQTELSGEWFYSLLEFDHCYHQSLSYINQCISMAKHISASYCIAIVTDHLVGGGEGEGGLQPQNSPLDPPLWPPLQPEGDDNLQKKMSYYPT